MIGNNERRQIIEDEDRRCSEVSDLIGELKREEELTPTSAQRIFERLRGILLDGDAEIAWDDAWDALDHLVPKHSSALPLLFTMSEDNGDGGQRSRYLRYWAIRAIGKVGVGRRCSPGARPRLDLGACGEGARVPRVSPPQYGQDRARGELKSVTCRSECRFAHWGNYQPDSAGRGETPAFAYT